MSIDVTTKGDDLKRERWSFTVTNNFSDVVTLRLRAYVVEERDSKRHKWKSVKQWDSFNERAYHSSIKREEVNIPDWVKTEARSLLVVDVPDLEPRRKGGL